MIGLNIKPGIFEIDPFSILIDDQAVKAQAIILPLKPMAILPQSTKICFDDLLYLIFSKVFLVESPFDDLVFERIVVLPFEDEEVSLFIGAVAFFINEVMSF